MRMGEVKSLKSGRGKDFFRHDQTVWTGWWRKELLSEVKRWSGNSSRAAPEQPSNYITLLSTRGRALLMQQQLGKRRRNEDDNQGWGDDCVISSHDVFIILEIHHFTARIGSAFEMERSDCYVTCSFKPDGSLSCFSGSGQNGHLIMITNGAPAGIVLLSLHSNHFKEFSLFNLFFRCWLSRII